ncbi:hypothetical protein ZWY2020_045693 [Hordeum vulgare]|nr:hypothetical protein ZWY2020_045693 [Hordeum vulgare]
MYKAQEVSRLIVPRETAAPTNIRPDDEAQQKQRSKHIEDCFNKLGQTFLDDLKKKILQPTNSSNPTVCLEECTITCVATVILKGVPQHQKEQYKWTLTSGKGPSFMKLENERPTPPSEDKTRTDGRTHTPEETSGHTTNDLNETRTPPHSSNSSTYSSAPADAAGNLSRLSLD